MHNTFIYRHSDLPPVRPEVKAEIVGIDVHIADLILKSQGNYRELQELAEVLDNCLDSCELNLNSIRIVADNIPVPAVNTMANLPIGEQSVIFSTALFSNLLLVALQHLTGAEIGDIVSDVSNQVVKKMGKISDEQITASLARFMGGESEHPKCNAFFVEIPTES
ncbi:MAG: hypothetical protein JGK04_31230 [Microcoleus sp. PH2017_39_LGB_O_B]|uniref:hypothetical protein n=1 Tax=unclassified Microcoleus TaxID=2642155 RepID=UPI001D9429D3|nr:MULTISPECIES: hypothetical protein [unclassified Microcoleus]TAF92890.1 MAG: hypothetical protein EAZ49_00545 [Oscillatoriales cyanobacterium]MCC3451862.1 hypothetical protein [Microcoleus sp. PH2017_09_SFU_O_A]MCC3586684.1 hypothetical protein [Microcoleus sp. PH2017_30_WIL_O_A]MCC3632777.1 hypothetical protein [Microcoleus sp. PH2017_39_LGB_O_B]MCC3645013.1 hypothetical protein [Microcoleus sp. PH2017_33_LGB_O_A]